MTMGNPEGKTVAAREPKHQNTLFQLFHLRCLIDRWQALLMEIRGAQGHIEKNIDPQPDGPETMSLSEFLQNAPDRIQEQTERLDKLLAEFREELI